MADEKCVPTSSRALSPDIGEPHGFSLPVNSLGGHLGGANKTPVPSSSATCTSVATPDRPRARGITSHLRSLFPVKVGAGIVRDVRARALWYWSDWKDAWNYRVLPATALVFFAK